MELSAKCFRCDEPTEITVAAHRVSDDCFWLGIATFTCGCKPVAFLEMELKRGELIADGNGLAVGAQTIKEVRGL